MVGRKKRRSGKSKMDMIYERYNEMAYILVNNLKVERQRGEGFNQNVALKIIPITKSLKKLLLRMKYEQMKGSQAYLLAPDRTKTSSDKIMELLSKGFSHFYKQLNTGRTLQFKSLRKTYLTYLNATISGDTKKLSSHTTDAVLQKHYIDDKVISKAIKELNIFNV